jgi:lysophospholipase L1-like esterase
LRYQNVELHNIDDVVEEEGRGPRLQRIPEALREKVNPGARERSTWPISSEIRLAFEGDEAGVTLSSDTATDLVVYEGPFRSEQLVIGDAPQPVVLRRSESIAQLTGENRKRLDFSTDIFRLQFGGLRRGRVYLHDVQGEGIRPPAGGEVPALRYLAYGTSITQSASANYASLGYAAQAAWRLGADLINLGMGGSCHCEPEFADYIAAREDWDFATLALSVNMVGGFSLDEFHSRVDYMINKVAAGNPARPVVCITLYPYRMDLCADKDDQARAEAFREKLRQAVAASPHDNLHLIEGTDILTDIGGLTTDLVHPADNGMINMGENLAARIGPIVAASHGA